MWPLFVGGHGVPITIKAKKEGISPQDVVDRYHKIIKDSFNEFGISFDNYSRTSAAIHHDTASDFLKPYIKGNFWKKRPINFTIVSTVFGRSFCHWNLPKMWSYRKLWRSM